MARKDCIGIESVRRREKGAENLLYKSKILNPGVATARAKVRRQL
jgi:hypothetical protein